MLVCGQLWALVSPPEAYAKRALLEAGEAEAEAVGTPILGAAREDRPRIADKSAAWTTKQYLSQPCPHELREARRRADQPEQER
jgi:hypothetical protein